MNNMAPFAKTIKKKKTRTKSGLGFFESLSEIGSNTVRSLKEDVIGGTAKTIDNQLLNSDAIRPYKNADSDIDLEHFFQDEKEQAHQEGKEEGRAEERKFQRATKEEVIFSLADEQLKNEINGVRQEIEMLFEALGKIELEIENAISQDIVDPGVYHLNYYHKLRIALNRLRKSVQEGELWMEMWSSRANSSHYHKNAKKSGSKYTLSHERTVATQSG